MAQNNTTGFDLMVQISEAELNGQIEAAFAAGELFTPEITSNFSFGGATGAVALNLLTPILDLDRPSPNLGITIRFTESQLQITAPIPLTIAPLDGTIEIVDRAEVRAVGGAQQAVLEFTDSSPNVTISLSPASEALLAPLLAATGITLTQVLNQMATQVTATLANDIERLPLTPPIPVDADNEDPLVLNTFEVGTVNDMSTTNRDALTFGIRTSAATGGNVNLVTESFIPNGQPAVLMFGNHWLLFRVIRPFLANAIGVAVSAFDQPCTLNQNVPFQGATLRQLRAFVQGNRIRVEGQATDSGTGWSAVSNFSFFIDLALESGSIVVSATEPDVDTDVDLAWWVWLVSLGLGALFGGVVGAIVAAIVTAIVEAIVEGVADNLIGDGISDATSNIPPIPLGPIGEALSATNLLLDDMELHGTVTRRYSIPIKSAGTRTLDSGFALDLDSGVVSPMGSSSLKYDFSWDAYAGIRVGPGVGLQVLSQDYHSITQTDLEKYGYNGSLISPNTIPYYIPIPFVSWPTLVFGVLTNEGRFAKVAVQRELDGDLRVRYMTYDRATPTVGLTESWRVIEKGKEETFTNKDCITCVRYDVAWYGVIEAQPRLLSYPIDYQWCLCGHVLEDESGELQIASGTIRYEICGKRLHLWTTLGQALACELCISAIDHRDREFFTCIKVNQPGSKTRCCQPGRTIPKIPIQYLDVDNKLALAQWESIDSSMFNEHLRRAIHDGVRTRSKS